MTTSTVISRTPRLTTLNKVGLGLATLLAVGDLTSPFQPTPDGQEGPPYAVLLLGGVLGVLTVLGVILAFRTASRSALRLVAGSRIISAVLSLPAFFVDIPSALKIVVGFSVLLTVASVVMVMTPARDRAPVTD